MPDQPFLDLDALIRDIEAKAAEQPDLLAVLIVLLKMVIASDADPGLHQAVVSPRRYRLLR